MALTTNRLSRVAYLVSDDAFSGSGFGGRGWHVALDEPLPTHRGLHREEGQAARKRRAVGPRNPRAVRAAFGSSRSATRARPPSAPAQPRVMGTCRGWARTRSSHARTAGYGPRSNPPSSATCV